MDDETSAIGLRAARADAALKKLLRLLEAKGVISGDEAYSVLEEGADEAQDNLGALQSEPDDA